VYQLVWEEKQQAVIAKELGVGQPAVWHNAHKALWRLEALASYPEIDVTEVQEMMVGRKIGQQTPFTSQDADFVACLLQGLNQSEIAELHDVSQGRVRHVLVKAQAFFKKKYRGHRVSRALKMVMETHKGLFVSAKRPESVSTPDIPCPVSRRALSDGALIGITR